MHDFYHYPERRLFPQPQEVILILSYRKIKSAFAVSKKTERRLNRIFLEKHRESPYFYFGSTAPPEFTHSLNPPKSTLTSLNPFFIITSAARALDASSGHVQ